MAAVNRDSSVRNRSRDTRPRRAITAATAVEEISIFTDLSVAATPVDMAVVVVVVAKSPPLVVVATEEAFKVEVEATKTAVTVEEEAEEADTEAAKAATVAERATEEAEAVTGTVGT